MTSLALTGASGRMGHRLIALASKDPDFKILSVIARPDSQSISRDAGELAGIGAIGLPITFDLRPTPDVLIDFTAPTAMRHWLKTAATAGSPW